MNRRTLIIIIAIAIFVVIAILASQVGGVAIRTVQQQTGYALEGPELATRGVATAWTFTSPSGIANTTVAFQLRTTQQNVQLAQAPLNAGRVSIVFPCTTEVTKTEQATLSMIDTRTQEILVTNKFELLPPGPDCFGR